MMESRTPKFESYAFDCPFCNVYATMGWDPIANEDKYFLSSSKCLNCNEISIWKKTRLGFASFDEGKLVYPSTEINIEPEDNMPTDVKLDFNEAKSIFFNSPRAAAALLRLALQKLCIHLGEPGKNINTDIGALVSKGILNNRLQKAADSIRIVGNNAVHPGEMNNEDVDQVAEKLFIFINLIVRYAITEPKEIADVFGSTPQGARDAIEKRDNR